VAPDRRRRADASRCEPIAGPKEPPRWPRTTGWTRVPVSVITRRRPFRSKVRPGGQRITAAHPPRRDRRHASGPRDRPSGPAHGQETPSPDGRVLGPRPTAKASDAGMGSTWGAGNTNLKGVSDRNTSPGSGRRKPSRSWKTAKADRSGCGSPRRGPMPTSGPDRESRSSVVFIVLRTRPRDGRVGSSGPGSGFPGLGASKRRRTSREWVREDRAATSADLDERTGGWTRSSRVSARP
jgi:hypothetical protein